MPRKNKLKIAQQPADDASAEQPVTGRRGRKKERRKANPETQHRLRNVLFALIVVFLLAIIGTMVASQLLPEYEILTLPRKAIATVMEPIQDYFSSGTGWFFNYLRRLKLRSNLEYEYEQQRQYKRRDREKNVTKDRAYLVSELSGLSAREHRKRI